MQVVIALIVTPAGLPRAYEVLAGNLPGRPPARTAQRLGAGLSRSALGEGARGRGRSSAWQARSPHEFLIELGTAKGAAGRAYTLIDIHWPATEAEFARAGSRFALNKTKLRRQRRREGRYLPRSHLTTADPAPLGQQYVQLTEVEQAFKELKSDLAIRPLYHQRDDRIEAHIFVADGPQVTLTQRLRPRAVLEKVASLHRVDGHLPTTDPRELILTRYTEPEMDHRLLLKQ